jgi:hypothetical protein
MKIVHNPEPAIGTTVPVWSQSGDPAADLMGWAGHHVAPVLAIAAFSPKPVC